MSEKQAKDERMEALKKIEKTKMANSSAGLKYDGSEFTFKDVSSQSPFWNELRKLLDELAEFRAEAWIANHSKEKSR
jgi:hypothetical protein